jgi:hypothetical protein
MLELSKPMMSASDVSTSERTMKPAGSSALWPEPTGCLGTQTGLKPICRKNLLPANREHGMLELSNTTVEFVD